MYPRSHSTGKGTQAVCFLTSLTSRPDPTRSGYCRFRSCSLKPHPSCVTGVCFPETCPNLP